ncbi:hypothetical protein GCM10027344_05640 [Spelaeicoccus albus]|uniref:CBS domain-containing protein n=1 Tax=Spelaeicoccus albus TaxID=1280376 RepID=A0A7Z0A8T4_9MICO|nr:CBS domain-containing protein [Spelaeicoccus albus]
MRAHDLQTALPTVGRTTPVTEAARLIAADGASAIVITGQTGAPLAIAAAVDILRLMLPTYVLDDQSLAGVIDDTGGAERWAAIDRRTIGDLVDDEGVTVRSILTVDADATVMEVAARMLDAHLPVAYVAGTPAESPGFVTLGAVLDAFLDSRPSDDTDRTTGR